MYAYVDWLDMCESASEYDRKSSGGEQLRWMARDVKTRGEYERLKIKMACRRKWN